MGMTNALNLLCGLALFLYGMHVMGEGLTRASGGKLESILESLTKSTIKALLRGAGVDMASPAPIEDATRLFDELITEMERLL